MAIMGDSYEYNLLAEWADHFDCQGFYTCEIGVRMGMGSVTIMHKVRNAKAHIGIDPYANLKYQHYDNEPPEGRTADYTDQMRDDFLRDLKDFKHKRALDGSHELAPWGFFEKDPDTGKEREPAPFIFANMTDELFMSHPDNQDKKFAFVHFDGPHTTKAVITEAVWFANRSAPHTRFAFDDYKTYDMSAIAYTLTAFGFKTMQAGETRICLEKRT